MHNSGNYFFDKKYQNIKAQENKNVYEITRWKLNTFKVG